jgi:hypothetical protein
MARRSTPYLLDLGSDQETELSLAEWNELRAGGWIEPTGYKTARPRRGVVAWIRGGDLWMAPLARVPSVTAKWFLIWLFRVSLISAAQLAETVSQRKERVLFERERETQNEALLWRTFRHTKGANEFRWIPAKHKAEILRTLRPEMSGEAIA